MGSFKVSSIWVLDTGDFSIFGWRTALDYFSILYKLCVVVLISTILRNTVAIQRRFKSTARAQCNSTGLHCRT